MPKFEDAFIPGYQVGPLSPAIMDEMEREKKRRALRESLSKKRAAKIESINRERAPELTDQMISQAPQPQPMSASVPDMMPEPRDMMPMPSASSPSMAYGEKPEYSLGADLPTLDQSQVAYKGAVPRMGDKPDSKQMLYDYLTQRRQSEPQFQEDYRDLSRQAETGRVLNTFASGLGEMASMAGQVGGKRADTGDLKALPNAIYGAQRREADESLALRRLANQEQVSDIRLLRDLERGDLDALRTQKILADLNRQKQVPKVLPYFVPPTDGKPPQMVTMTNDGSVEFRDLPAGARPTAESYTLGQPVMQGNQVVYPQTSKGGDVRFVKGPEGSKTYEQMRIENQDEANKADRRLKEIEFERKEANDSQKKKLDEEKAALDKAKFDWDKKTDQEKMELERQKLEKPKAGKDVAGETLDRAFAKDYEQYIAMGGKAGLMKKLETLTNARNKLAAIEPPPRYAGALGESGMTLIAPQYSEIMSNVRGAIQETLRQTLGSQFTEREGEQILSRAFDPRQTKEANLRNLDREISQIVERAKAKQKSVDYFEKNGSLRGFQSGNQGAGKTVTRKQYSPSRNQTKITYSDGSTELVEGKQ